MSSGTIMQGGRATGYYSTFGNQTTIIQPGKAPVYIDSLPKLPYCQAQLPHCCLGL